MSPSVSFEQALRKCFAAEKATDNIVKTYKITKNDRTMIIMPLFHVHGLVASFMAALKAGSAVIIPPRLAPSFWKDFAAHKATWYTATPTMHKILVSFPLPSPMPTIRFIRSCSSPLAPQTLQTLEDKFKAPVLEAYAMTEASHQITSNPLPPAPHHAGSVGLPGGDIELRILSPNAEEAVPQGSEGEICIRSSSVTAGYLSNPTANASSFTADGHFFRTGDFGKLDQNGYLYLTGRIKEFINKGGEKISPVEIDHLIAGHELVKDVVAFAMADEVYGQELGVAVVLSEGAALGERELKKWVRERMAPLKVPKKVCITFLSPVLPSAFLGDGVSTSSKNRLALYTIVHDVRTTRPSASALYFVCSQQTDGSRDESTTAPEC